MELVFSGPADKTRALHGESALWERVCVFLFLLFFFATEYKTTSVSTHFHCKNYFHLLSIYRVPGTVFSALNRGGQK